MKKSVLSFILLVSIFLFCLTGCSGDVSSVDMQAVYDSYSPYLPEMVILDEKDMLNLYGVDSEKCAQAIVATCSDGLRSDEVWLIEAVDDVAAEEIVQFAQNRIEREGEETKNYAPEQYAVVEKAQIIDDGNNIVMIISPDVDTLVELYNSAK